MKIALINVKYSPNLGDGVIAECLEAGLKERIPGTTVVSVDVGGRDGFGHGGSLVGKGLGLMRIVRTLPKPLQKLTDAYLVPLLVKARYGERWRETLHDCDAVIVGGGQLFQDVDLYFPMRIARAVRSAPRGVPILVYAVGVSRRWTPRAVRLFASAFRHGELKFAAARDDLSARHWAQHFPGLQVSVTRDPGLLAAECYRDVVGAKTNNTRKVLAIGVSDLHELQQHSERSADVAFGDIGFYQELIRRLSGDFDLRFFTNGADLDNAFLEGLKQATESDAALAASGATFLAPPRTPSELVSQIAEADGILSHRLHANIVGYSFGLPTVGLGWDNKLKSFFESTGRSEFFIGAGQTDIGAVITTVRRAMDAGYDEIKRLETIAETKKGIDALIAHLIAAVAPTKERQGNYAAHALPILKA
ncbi:polysaccharide pyruvyl transferase family protein [Propionivibrio soli]|uniref:polysaccharide pyruvyl transferase family protein n=1 Tax=Propionivibrio soli TaxID=2976531 RepID=UPI0021E851E1|nr:polysaccharide pyruvyl transferase family protein [Propionivibrio soli]